MSSTKINIISGISQIAADFDAFIIDQWGVLHDGYTAYKYSLDTLRQLKADGKKILILTNSGKRAAANVAKLASTGIERTMYDYVLSSGEAFHISFKSQAFDFYKGACFYISPANDHYAWQDLNIDFTPHINDCSWILLSSVSPTTDHSALLAKLSSVKPLRPMVCLNPDLLGLTKDNQTFPAPGTLAKNYSQLGAEVIYLGKPFPEVYAIARQLLPANSRILAIGDSLDHDIKGALNSGLRSLFIGQGIYNRQLTAASDQKTVLADLAREHQAQPDYYSFYFKC